MTRDSSAVFCAVKNVEILLNEPALLVLLLWRTVITCCFTSLLLSHRGHCLLFSTGAWQESDGQFNVNWASQAYCNYTIFVGVILFVTSAIQIYRLSMFVYKGSDSSFLSAFGDVVSCLILCAMTIVAALMITLGFMSWCQEMTKRFPSCDVAAGKAIDLKDSIDTAGFHIEMGTAQFGAWASVSCWVGLTVFAVLKLCRYHQLENMRVSMFLERQRLINGGSGPSPSSTLERTDDESAPNPKVEVTSLPQSI